MRTTNLSSMLAVAAAAVVAGMLAMGPMPLTGQPPAPGKGVKATPGEPGGNGGKAGAKQPAGPVPRTKDGKPDLSGFWNGVTPGGNVDIEPGAPKGGGKAKQGVIVNTENSRVPYTPAARAKSDDIIANKMFLEPELHCFMSGVPHNMWVQFGMQTIQTKDYVVFMWEFQHSRRIIPLDNRPHTLPPAVRQFQGESVGHWEGDTLVVSTKNLNDKTWLDTSGHYAPEDMEVIERYTMVDANTINFEATATSKEFTQPMELKGTMSRAQANDPTYEQMEFACIEGNRDLEHYTEDKGGKAKYTGGLKQ